MMRKNQFLGFVAEYAKLCNFCTLRRKKEKLMQDHTRQKEKREYR
jgi:hypothetical protein